MYSDEELDQHLLVRMAICTAKGVVCMNEPRVAQEFKDFMMSFLGRQITTCKEAMATEKNSSN